MSKKRPFMYAAAGIAASLVAVIEGRKFRQTLKKETAERQRVAKEQLEEMNKKSSESPRQL